MSETSAVSGEMVWAIIVVLIIIAVGVVFFMLNPQMKTAAEQLMCRSYYDVLYFFGGPRPPIELCASGSTVPTATTITGPLLPGVR